MVHEAVKRKRSKIVSSVSLWCQQVRVLFETTAWPTITRVARVFGSSDELYFTKIMNISFGVRPLYLYAVLCASSIFKNDVRCSEGAVRECCEPMSPTPSSYTTSEFPSDYIATTEVVQPGMW